MPREKRGSSAWRAILLLAALVVAAGCTSNNGGSEAEGSEGNASNPPASDSVNGSGAQQGEGAAGKNVTVSMMNTYFSETAPSDEGEVVRSIEQFSKAELDITWVPQNVYAERLNVTMASGDMPQVLMVDNPFHTSILNGVRSGMFWELDGYLDEFPNLQTFDPALTANLQIEGKTYVIPRPRPLVRNGLIIRKDWLDNVGMELPRTIDDFYELLVAFKDDDPDGNGQDDTYGMMLYEGSIPRDIFSWFGAPNNWKLEDGAFVKDIETAEFREGLRFVRRLYKEGLINADFPVVVRNEARRDLYNDRVGVSMEALDAVVPFYYFQMNTTGNRFELVAGHPVEGKANATSGHYGGAMIPKTSVRTEEELREVLRYFDTQRSAEATEQFRVLVTENETREDDAKFNIDDLKNIIVNEVAMYPPGDSELNQMLRARMEEHADVSVADPSLGLLSPTQIEQGQQLNELLSDAIVQFVLGEIDEGGLDTAVEQWRSRGGGKVAEELAALYGEQRS
ncbi:extracellular solute-binding protein [Paenibacillus sp. IB182496]|uniref:Extracellular solute-binding protein n=1 Tax=Paenibacillus sabuli TaxID=2772509 RepID=A0A927BQ90_9BACL|nr:extracellular solute-binding protein [Paenibacillus sabuli]MBD2843951.1 extracellular solute-binding protein [Paenibacillus sabuli]